MGNEIPTYEAGSLEEKLQGWEKEKKGFISDLQAEREKRHSLEERLAQIEQNLPPAGEDGETPEARVNALAADPDGYISEVVREAIEPITKHISSLVIERKLDRARKAIARKEGIDIDDVDDKLGDELVRIGKERGFTTLDPEKGVLASYDILLQERREKAEREAQRDRNISGQATETVRTPARTGTTRFTRSEIGGMSKEIFNANYDAIKQAEREGLIS